MALVSRSGGGKTVSAINLRNKDTENKAIISFVDRCLVSINQTLSSCFLPRTRSKVAEQHSFNHYAFAQRRWRELTFPLSLLLMRDRSREAFSSPPHDKRGIVEDKLRMHSLNFS